MLNPKQQQALDAMRNGRSIFLSGEAGTGKSFVLHQYIGECAAACKKVVACAPTGIAANNINGVTLHRAFGIEVGVLDPRAPVAEPPQWIKDADVIIIDEISMCRIDVFDYVIRSLYAAEHLDYLDEFALKTAPMELRFGKQLIIVGDFFQLPPVIIPRDLKALKTYYGDDSLRKGYAFLSPLWDALGLECIYLEEVVRQEDAAFSSALAKIRKKNHEGIDWILAHHHAERFPNAISLCPTRKKVTEINTVALDNLQGEAKEYKATSRGIVTDNDKPTDDVIQLKIGVHVMCLANDTEGRYVNGSFGTVVTLNEKNVVIALDGNGAEVEIAPFTWIVLGYRRDDDDADGAVFEKKEIGRFTQIPLKLAYAVTIHKSQGKTFDCPVNIDPNCFEAGQLYTALSRVSKIENLHIEGAIKPNKVIIDKVVTNFYDKLLGTTTIIDEASNNATEPSSGRGGTRQGAGRPCSNGEPMKAVSIRMTRAEEAAVRELLMHLRTAKTA